MTKFRSCKTAIIVPVTTLAATKVDESIIYNTYRRDVVIIGLENTRSYC